MLAAGGVRLCVGSFAQEKACSDDSLSIEKTGRTVSGIGRLIVGTSGSPGSLQALRYGEILARELRHGRLAWAVRHRSLTPEQVLRDRDRPAA